MRPLTILGIILILGGGIVLVRGLNMTTKKNVADIGPIEVTTTETKTVPSWLGAVVAVAGVALVLAGSGSKN